MLNEKLIEDFGDAMARAMRLAIEMAECDGSGIESIEFDITYHGRQDVTDFVSSYITCRQNFVKMEHNFKRL